MSEENICLKCGSGEDYICVTCHAERLTTVRKDSYEYARDKKSVELKSLVWDNILEMHKWEVRQSNTLKLKGVREARRMLEDVFDKI